MSNSRETEILKNALLELGRANIPRAYSDYYTHTLYMGDHYEEAVDETMVDAERLKRTVEQMSENLARYKNPKEIEKFKQGMAQFVSPAALPYCQTAPKFIEDRENLAAEIEPLMEAVRKAYENYLKAKAEQEAKETSEQRPASPVMTFEDYYEKEKVFEIAADTLKKSLLMLNNVKIPTIGNYSLGHTSYFGTAYKKNVERLMVDAEYLQGTVEDMSKLLAEYKDQNEIEKFKQMMELFTCGLSLSASYRELEMINERENLAAEMEPRMKAVREAYADYLKAKAAQEAGEAKEIKTESVAFRGHGTDVPPVATLPLSIAPMTERLQVVPSVSTISIFNNSSSPLSAQASAIEEKKESMPPVDKTSQFELYYDDSASPDDSFIDDAIIQIVLNESKTEEKSQVDATSSEDFPSFWSKPKIDSEIELSSLGDIQAERARHANEVSETIRLGTQVSFRAKL